jgi:hypothetical protein
VELQGEETLSEYEFVSQDSLHSFCSICGVSVLVKVLGKEENNDICPINVRTIERIDIESLALKKYDWRGIDPPYALRN